MRSTILLSSVLAIGAVAKPILDKRYYVTKVDLEIKTVTIYVTPGAPEATAAAVPTYGGRHRHSHVQSKSSAVVAVPSSTSSAYSPPAYTPAPTPTPTPTPVYTSAAQVSSTPAYDGSHPTGTAQATLSSGPDYQAMVLYHHNAARSNHGASPLTWDTGAEQAAAWSANQCIFKHQFPNDNALKHGQNIFTNSGAAFNVSAGITESWYKGELPAMAPYYGQDSLDMTVFEGVGHLTQMVWKGTSKVGCATVDCSGRMKMGDGSSTDMDKFTVCNYADDAGNMMGDFAKNVQAPISNTNLGHWYD